MQPWCARRGQMSESGWRNKISMSCPDGLCHLAPQRSYRLELKGPPVHLEMTLEGMTASYLQTSGRPLKVGRVWDHSPGCHSSALAVWARSPSLRQRSGFSPAHEAAVPCSAEQATPLRAVVTVFAFQTRSLWLREVLDDMVSAVVPRLLVSLLLLLRTLPAVAYSVPLQAAFLEDTGGSGEAEGSSASSPSLPPPRTPALSPTSLGPRPTPLAGPRPPTNFLDGIVDFFRQYVMLIAVVGSLVFLLMFIVCAALITRQKHKASAYYPSSFPKKKYVDQSDRAGGPRAFSEVPDRAPDGRSEEALDSSQQLQADILAATQNLKSPARAALGGGDGARMEGKSEEDESGSREGGQEAQGRGVPVEKAEVLDEPCAVGAEEALEAGQGQGESEAAPSSAQEARGPAGPPESPCACGIAPKV
ncbi:transmembrane protein 119 isoform X2 [Lynx canadensis]|nr:transmembrane protein 119 isoform X2 [Lynx canadensis]